VSTAALGNWTFGAIGKAQTVRYLEPHHLPQFMQGVSPHDHSPPSPPSATSPGVASSLRAVRSTATWFARCKRSGIGRATLISNIVWFARCFTPGVIRSTG
jgi:hypothetical protein